MIEAINLSKQFNHLHAAQNVYINLQQGDVLGFLGPNGAGKTTTMRMIAGYLPPDAGEVKIAGINIWQQPIKAKSNIGYLPEGAPLYPEMTALQLLNFVGKMRKMPKNLLKERLDFVITNLNIATILNKPIDTLSKGFKRRVGIALAILHDPKVLILDEPTDGLDPLQKQEVRSLIKKMAENKAIIISTHILEEVDAVCNKCAIIAGGKVIYDGSVNQLRASYQNDNIETIFCQIVQENQQPHR